MAQRLLRAGIQYAEGFSVNVASRQTTRRSYQWGRELSDLLGRREFVIDTSGREPSARRGRRRPANRGRTLANMIEWLSGWRA